MTENEEGQEIPAQQTETNEDTAFNLMKFIAGKENKQLSQEDIREYYLNLYSECYDVVYACEKSTVE